VTEKSQHRLTLVLAFIGALLIVVLVSGSIINRNSAQMPGFMKSMPALPDWPTHQHLPVG